MNKNHAGTRLLMLKITCIALAMMLGGILFTTGVFADSGCGVKCCCQSTPIYQHHNSGKQLRSSMGCCTGAPTVPCDLESAPTIKLPAFTLSSIGNGFSNVIGLAGDFTDSHIDLNAFRGNFSLQLVQEKSKSPPIYLQNLSFLI